MKKVSEVVQRLKPHSIGDDCVQLIVPYQKSLTLLNKDGILYHHIPGSSLHINKYLEDERRKQFPYSNIPTHRAQIGFSKWNYTNQIFNYDEPYITIVDNHIIESCVVKDGNSALTISSAMKTFKNFKFMTKKELDKLFEIPTTGNQQLYVMKLDGGFYEEDYSVTIPSEEQLLERQKHILTKKLEKYKKEIFGSRGYYPEHFNKFDVEILQNCIDNMSTECMVSETIFMDDNIITIRINDKDISIQMISARFMKPDCYKVYTVDIPVNKYTLEQLKFLTPKISLLKEPKITTRLNPGLSKSEINEAKRLVKTIDKNNINRR